MSKRHTNAANFLTRSSDKSMNGFASGYCDVLPPQAKDVPIEGIIDQYEQLCLEVSRWELIKKKRKLTKAETDRYCSVKGMWGNLKKTITRAGEESRAWVFMRVAYNLLRGDKLREINNEVDKVILRSRNEQNNAR